MLEVILMHAKKAVLEVTVERSEAIHEVIAERSEQNIVVGKVGK